MAKEMSLVFDTEYVGLSSEELNMDTQCEVLRIVEEGDEDGEEEEVFLPPGLLLTVIDCIAGRL